MLKKILTKLCDDVCWGVYNIVGWYERVLLTSATNFDQIVGRYIFLWTPIFLLVMFLIGRLGGLWGEPLMLFLCAATFIWSIPFWITGLFIVLVLALCTLAVLAQMGANKAKDYWSEWKEYLKD